MISSLCVYCNYCRRQWLCSGRILAHRGLVETSRLPEVKSGLFKGPLSSWKCLWLSAVKKQYRHPQPVFITLHERGGIRKGLDWEMPHQTHTLLSVKVACRSLLLKVQHLRQVKQIERNHSKIIIIYSCIHSLFCCTSVNCFFLSS